MFYSITINYDSVHGEVWSHGKLDTISDWVDFAKNTGMILWSSLLNEDGEVVKHIRREEAK